MNCHPFFWDHGKLIDLNTDTLGGNPITANGINDAGEVVGNAIFPNGAKFGDAYLWKDAVITNLKSLPGDCYSEAFAINSQGQAVGQSFNCNTGISRSILWEDGAMFDLNTLIPANSRLLLDNTFAISDGGEIAGFGVPAGCARDTACGLAFVLIPCNRENGDEEGCQEAGEVTSAAIQDHSLRATQSISPNLAGDGLTSEEFAAWMLARFGRNHGLGIWPRK